MTKQNKKAIIYKSEIQNSVGAGMWIRAVVRTSGTSIQNRNRRPKTKMANTTHQFPVSNSSVGCRVKQLRNSLYELEESCNKYSHEQKKNIRKSKKGETEHLKSDKKQRESKKKKKKQSVATFSPKRKGEEQGTKMTEAEPTWYVRQSRRQ